MRSFASWVLNGFYHSFILYVASELLWAWDGQQSDGKVAGHWVWGTALYTAALVTVLLKASLVVNIWTKYTVLAIPGSFVLWVLLLPLYAWVAPKLGFSTEFEGVNQRLWSSLVFWAMVLVLPPLCLIRDFAWK
jgi:phospholipid-transporting ATPase